MSTPLALAAVIVMALSLLLIPVGLPGLWVMVGIAALGLIAGEISLGIFFLLFGLAVAAELIEWAAVDRLGRKFGGSTRTFWGALIGGGIGVLVGAPVPVAGSLIGAFVGTLGGAVLATWLETRRLADSVRAGWGAMLGRAVAVGVKVFVGLVILVLGGGALLIR